MLAAHSVDANADFERMFNFEGIITLDIMRVSRKKLAFVKNGNNIMISHPPHPCRSTRKNARGANRLCLSVRAAFAWLRQCLRRVDSIDTIQTAFGIRWQAGLAEDNETKAIVCFRPRSTSAVREAFLYECRIRWFVVRKPSYQPGAIPGEQKTKSKLHKTGQMAMNWEVDKTHLYFNHFRLVG
jgi:hypothetical protein